jgi:hypothetical protein
MSYDLRIFLPHVEFPAQTWYEMLESFRGSDCDVLFDDPSPTDSGGVKPCRIVVGHSVISIDAWAERDAPSSCAPEGTRWGVCIDTTMGRSPRAWFIQHAIPYHALVCLPGVTVHDCQYHVGRTVEQSSWSAPETWRSLAEKRLWRMGDKQSLIELGLFHADGRIRF